MIIGNLSVVTGAAQVRIAQVNQEKSVRNELEQAALNLKFESDYNSDTNKGIREKISGMGKQIVPLLEKMKTEGISRSAFEAYILSISRSSVDSGIKEAIYTQKNEQFHKFIEEILKNIK